VNIEYIYDEKGRKKSVIVPLEIWEELMKKRNAIKKKRDVKKYRGIVKATEDIEKEIEELRDEWERI